MNLLKTTIRFLFGWLIPLFGSLNRTSSFLGRLDVDAIGRGVFKHCSSPKALYVTLIERWWVLAVCALIGIGVGVYSVATAVERYESHGKLLVYQKLPTFMDDSTRLPDPKAYDSLFATHIALIGSPLIIDKAIENCNLLKRCPDIGACLDHNNDYTDYIGKHLKINRAGSGDSKGAFVISVGFEHGNATESSTVVEAILETYRAYVNESMLSDQSKAVSVVTELEKKYETDVREKGIVYREFLKKAPGVWDKETLNNSHQKRVEAFEIELTELQINYAALQSRIKIMSQKFDPITGQKLTDLQRLAMISDEHISRLEMLLSVKSDKLVEMYQNDYPELQERANARYDGLMKLYVERDEMKKYLGKNHPKILDINSSIALMESRLKQHQIEEVSSEQRFKVDPADIVAAYQRMLSEELADVEKRLAFVKQSINREIAASKALTDFSLQARQLEEEFRLAQEMHTSLLDKAQKQDALNRFGSYIAEVIAYPHFEGKLVWPKIPVLITLFTILGLFVGTFLAIALDLIALTPLKSAFWFLPAWLLDQHRSPSTGV